MDPLSHSLTPRIQVDRVTGSCLVRITNEQRRELDRLLFHRYPDGEWGTFFRFGYRKTKWGILACFVELIPPNRGELDKQSPLVEFSPGYIGRALSGFEGNSLGIGFIHSHPEGCPPGPSPADDDMDGYFATEFERFSGGRPYLSLIVSRDDQGGRSFSGRCFHGGQWTPVEQWLTIGRSELRREQDFRFKPEAAGSPTIERVTQLLGMQASGRLRFATVGVVGCSGLGSPAAHILARAGVGKFVLVDPGEWKASGLERNHASRASDLNLPAQPKVELLKRLILEIRPDTEVVTVADDILCNESVDHLALCDIVLGCTDSFYARAALGDLATHYMVPVIDLAVQMDARDGCLTNQVGEFARYFAGLPCPWCRKRVNAAAIRTETATQQEREQARSAAAAAEARGEDGAQYWIGPQRNELTVGYMTTLVAAIGAGYAHNWLTGAAEMPHDRFQFELSAPSFGFAADACAPQPDCACQRCIGWADQGRADFTVSRVAHWL